METTIQVRGLSKSYTRNKVIENINLSVAAGEVYGLLGANGVGKSTTIECILGTQKADSGTVRILGLDPWENRKQLFEQVGVQFQESNYPDKIKVRAFVSELSGGQKQKLFIVLALIPNPKVVFLDELTTGLDTKARRGVWKSLQELREQGLTIFLSSHFMDEVEILCDRIGILKDGGFVFEGTVQEAVALSPYERLEDAYLWFTGEEETDDE